MSCERARELILDGLIEPLDDERARELHRHLDGCEACAVEAARYRELWRDLGSAAVPRPEADALARFEALLEAEGGRAQQGRRWSWRGLLRRAAGILLLIGLGAALTAGWNALRQPSGPVEGQRFLLILTETSPAPDVQAQFAGEMRAWVGSLRQQGIVESFDGVFPSTPDATPPGGPLMADDVFALIVIRVSGPDEARRIALQSPSLDYGGLVEIRAIN